MPPRIKDGYIPQKNTVYVDGSLSTCTMYGFIFYWVKTCLQS